MWIMLSIYVRMVQTVHFAIGAWTQIATALRNEGENIEELFPKRTHRKHSMRRIAMQKEGLRENG